MRTMVTGGAGFIGSTLVERLLAEGHQVDVVDDLSTGSLANLADARASGGRGLTIHHLDIRLPDLVELMVHRRPEVIFHLAAHDEVEDSIRHPGLDAEVNVLGSLNVMEGARSAGSERIVFAASGLTLYGAPLPADLPVRESHVHRPISPTGVSKKAVLDYLVAYRELHAVEFASPGPGQRLRPPPAGRRPWCSGRLRSSLGLGLGADHLWRRQADSGLRLRRRRRRRVRAGGDTRRWAGVQHRHRPGDLGGRPLPADGRRSRRDRRTRVGTAAADRPAPDQSERRAGRHPARLEFVDHPGRRGSCGA